VCVCVYIYTHTHIYIYIYTHTNTHTHIQRVPKNVYTFSERKFVILPACRMVTLAFI